MFLVAVIAISSGQGCRAKTCLNCFCKLQANHEWIPLPFNLDWLPNYQGCVYPGAHRHLWAPGILYWNNTHYLFLYNIQIPFPYSFQTPQLLYSRLFSKQKILKKRQNLNFEGFNFNEYVFQSPVNKQENSSKICITDCKGM